MSGRVRCHLFSIVPGIFILSDRNESLGHGQRSGGYSLSVTAAGFIRNGEFQMMLRKFTADDFAGFFHNDVPTFSGGYTAQNQQFVNGGIEVVISGDAVAEFHTNGTVDFSARSSPYSMSF